MSVSSKMSLFFSLFPSVLCVSMVAMPTGYEIVISRTLRCMAFIALGLRCNKCHTSLAPMI